MKEITTKEMAIDLRQGKYDTGLRKWIWGNCYTDIERDMYTEKDEHIIHCLKSIVSELFDICPCGSFGKAILNNNFRETVAHADDTNLYMLKIYMLFLCNLLPYQKIKEYRERK